MWKRTFTRSMIEQWIKCQYVATICKFKPLISFLETKFEHVFYYVLHTYNVNKKDDIVVPCKGSINLLLDCHFEIFGLYFLIDLTSKSVEIFILGYKMARIWILLI
jgi:hypothetical protein